MVGVVLRYTTLPARAADVVVTASANGPLPPMPAVILNPKNGDHFTDFPIPVSGTCPPSYLVKLFRNQTFSGSTQCNSNGTFLIYTDLFLGKNELETRIYNAADQEGPRSDIVIVYLDELPAPVTPSKPTEHQPPTEAQQPPASQVRPFFITSDIYFKAIYEGDSIDWRFGIVGGDMPFHVTVAWGDGSTSVLNNLRTDTFTVTHTYNKGSASREYYPVAASVIDVNGRKASLQVFTILNNHLIPGLSSGSATAEQDREAFWRRVILSTYGVTTLMALSFWLGERRELSALVRHLHGHRPKPRKV